MAKIATKKRFEDEEYFIEQREKDGDDIHFLIGKKDGTDKKMHVIVDVETGEIRVEGNQIIDDEVARKITAIIELPNGKIIRTDRYLVVEDEPEEKDTLNYFVYLLDNYSWHKENIRHEEIYFSEKNYNFQIKKEFTDNDFNESWAKVYPDKTTGKYYVYLYLNGSPVKEIIFISCDGGRIFVSLPDIDFNKDEKNYYWDKNSIGYKVMNIIGEYYIYNSIEGIAKQSNIKIKS